MLRCLRFFNRGFPPNNCAGHSNRIAQVTSQNGLGNSTNHGNVFRLLYILTQILIKGVHFDTLHCKILCNSVLLKFHISIAITLGIIVFSARDSRLKKTIILNLYFSI